MVAPRYIVSTRRTGLGDRLVSLAAAWGLARDTGRTLVADWRFSAYALDGKTNLFTLCFEKCSDLAGVPFVGDDSVSRLGLPGNPKRTVLDAIRHRLTGCRRLTPEEAASAIRSGRDVKGRAILLDACLFDRSMPVEECRQFMSALRPRAHIADAVAAFHAGLGDGPIIGLHVRYGNSGNIMNHARYWTSFAPAMARCVAAVEHARERSGASATVMLCTDSLEVEQAMKDSIPRLATRPKMYRHPGAGELHLWPGASLGRDDAMIEMLLLAKCDALIRYPPDSLFSLYGAVMRHRHDPQPRMLDDLARRWNPGDTLSPAILL
jgi:hypothetical protein